MRMRPRLLALTSLSLLVAALGACGNEDDGSKHGVDTGSPESGVDSVDLTEDWGCGYGFAVSDKAQEALLSVYYDGGSKQVDGTVFLPDAAWEAQLQVGTNLAANWCNDVIMDPQAEVDETWKVVEGTLTFAGEVPPVDGATARQPVRAELTGVVVESPDGERVELGDISLANDGWGFFAG
jgi:hypothetical protein